MQRYQQYQSSPFFIGPKDTDKACLLIHGFVGTPAELRELGEALAEQGIRAHGIVLPGHEGNPEGLVNIGWKQWLAFAEQGLAELASYPHVFLAGLSMGALLSLLLASRHPDRIAGTIVMSTPTRISGGWPLKLLPVARHFVKWYYPLSKIDFSDPEMQAEALKQAQLRDPEITIDFSDTEVITYMKRMIRIPVSAIDELVRLTDITRQRLGLVRSPLLIIQSKRDQTVNPACAEELFRLATAAEPKSLHWLERSDHVITIGPEKEEVFRLAVSFIEATVPGAAKIALPGDAPQDGAGETFPGH
jgi:carboxylesterase